MFFYLLALPIYSFFLPVYSFWHFDDFSWGNTRVVVGDSQRKIIVTDDEKFDQKMIPMKKWSVYEQELWEMGSQYSRSSGRTYTSNPTSFSGMYGYDGYPSNMMMMPPGSIRSGVSDYDYYRDTRVMPMMNERSRHSYMNQNSTMSNSGSVIGAEYGQQTMGPMSDYMRNSEVSSPNLVQNHQQPMHFASNNGEYIHPQPMMMMPNDSGYNLYGGQQFDTASFQQTYSQISTPEGFPTDDDIVAEIQSILSTADLMSITKKQGKKKNTSILFYLY
jgi:chitin synthase